MNTHKELLSECCSAKPLDELAYDNSGRCGDCKEGCMFVAECETSCGINADPADGFGRCTCGNERLEPTPPSQIEEIEESEIKKIQGANKYIVMQWEGDIRDIQKEQGDVTLCNMLVGKVYRESMNLLTDNSWNDRYCNNGLCGNCKIGYEKWLKGRMGK